MFPVDINGWLSENDDQNEDSVHRGVNLVSYYLVIGLISEMKYLKDLTLVQMSFSLNLLGCREHGSFLLGNPISHCSWVVNWSLVGIFKQII